MCIDKKEKENQKKDESFLIKELFKDYKSDYHPEVVDWGPDVGAEILPPYYEESHTSEDNDENEKDR